MKEGRGQGGRHGRPLRFCPRNKENSRLLDMKRKKRSGLLYSPRRYLSIGNEFGKRSKNQVNHRFADC